MMYAENEIIFIENKIRTDERECIIKLLENDICPDWTMTCCDGWCGAYVGAIKLIREKR